jgi:bifunctional DNA-binding transcriptional regulator/antitoxin component of YhaV-PrlF toxin-antitoxin module
MLTLHVTCDCVRTKVTKRGQVSVPSEVRRKLYLLVA